MINNIHRQYQKNKNYGGISQGYLLILNILDCIMEIIHVGTSKIVITPCLVSDESAYMSKLLPRRTL